MEIRKQNCENRKPKFWTEETKIVEIRNQIHGNNLFQIRNQIVKKKKNQNCGNKKPKLWKYEIKSVEIGNQNCGNKKAKL